MKQQAGVRHTWNAALNWDLMQKGALYQYQFEMFAWQYIYILYRQNTYWGGYHLCTYTQAQ